MVSQQHQKSGIVYESSLLFSYRMCCEETSCRILAGVCAMETQRVYTQVDTQTQYCWNCGPRLRKLHNRRQQGRGMGMEAASFV